MNEESVVNAAGQLYGYLAYQVGKKPDLSAARLQLALRRAAAKNCHCLTQQELHSLTQLIR